MFIDDNNIQGISQLGKELKAYVELQKEYTKLELTEKLTILFSKSILALVLILLGLTVLFFLSFALVYLLVPFVGSLTASFAIVAGVILLLVVVLLVFKKGIIINPIANFLANLLINKSK